jgi:hypothetical protein
MIYPFFRRLAKRAGLYITTRASTRSRTRTRTRSQSYPLSDGEDLKVHGKSKDSTQVSKKRRFRHPLSLPESQWRDDEGTLTGTGTGTLTRGGSGSASRGSGRSGSGSGGSRAGDEVGILEMHPLPVSPLSPGSRDRSGSLNANGGRVFTGYKDDGGAEATVTSLSRSRGRSASDEDDELEMGIKVVRETIIERG